MADVNDSKSRNSGRNRLGLGNGPVLSMDRFFQFQRRTSDKHHIKHKGRRGSKLSIVTSSSNVSSLANLPRSKKSTNLNARKILYSFINEEVYEYNRTSVTISKSSTHQVRYPHYYNLLKFYDKGKHTIQNETLSQRNISQCMAVDESFKRFREETEGLQETSRYCEDDEESIVTSSHTIRETDEITGCTSPKPKHSNNKSTCNSTENKNKKRILRRYIDVIEIEEISDSSSSDNIQTSYSIQDSRNLLGLNDDVVIRRKRVSGFCPCKCSISSTSSSEISEDVSKRELICLHKSKKKTSPKFDEICGTTAEAATSHSRCSTSRDKKHVQFKIDPNIHHNRRSKRPYDVGSNPITNRKQSCDKALGKLLTASTSYSKDFIQVDKGVQSPDIFIRSISDKSCKNPLKEGSTHHKPSVKFNEACGKNRDNPQLENHRKKKDYESHPPDINLKQYQCSKKNQPDKETASNSYPKHISQSDKGVEIMDDSKSNSAGLFVESTNSFTDHKYLGITASENFKGAQIKDFSEDILTIKNNDGSEIIKKRFGSSVVGEEVIRTDAGTSNASLFVGADFERPMEKVHDDEDFLARSHNQNIIQKDNEDKHSTYTTMSDLEDNENIKPLKRSPALEKIDTVDRIFLNTESDEMSDEKTVKFKRSYEHLAPHNPNKMRAHIYVAKTNNADVFCGTSRKKSFTSDTISFTSESIDTSELFKLFTETWAESTFDHKFYSEGENINEDLSQAIFEREESLDMQDKTESALQIESSNNFDISSHNLLSNLEMLGSCTEMNNSSNLDSTASYILNSLNTVLCTREENIIKNNANVFVTSLSSSSAVSQSSRHLISPTFTSGDKINICSNLNKSNSITGFSSTETSTNKDDDKKCNVENSSSTKQTLRKIIIDLTTRPNDIHSETSICISRNNNSSNDISISITKTSSPNKSVPAVKKSLREEIMELTADSNGSPSCSTNINTKSCDDDDDDNTLNVTSAFSDTSSKSKCDTSSGPKQTLRESIMELMAHSGDKIDELSESSLDSCEEEFVRKFANLKMIDKISKNKIDSTLTTESYSDSCKITKSQECKLEDIQETQNLRQYEECSGNILGGSGDGSYCKEYSTGIQGSPCDTTPLCESSDKEKPAQKEPVNIETGFFREGGEKKRIDMVLVAADDGDCRYEKIRIQYLINLLVFGLQIECEPGKMAEHKRLIFIKIHAPNNIIEGCADYFKCKRFFLESRLAYIGTRVGILEKIFPQFQCVYEKEWLQILRMNYNPPGYSNLNRSEIVYSILQRTPFSDHKNDIGITKLLQRKIFVDAYPLHDGPYFFVRDQEITKVNGRQILYYEWARKRRWYRSQPLHIINEYMGDRVSLYFAFYGFYNVALLIASIVGVLFTLMEVFDTTDEPIVKATCDASPDKYVCSLCRSFKVCPPTQLSKYCFKSKLTNALDNPFTFLFAFFISVWAMAFITFWRRYENYLCWFWEIDKEEIKNLPRDGFEMNAKEIKRSKLTGILKPFVSNKKKIIKIVIITSIFLLCFVTAFLSVSLMILFKYVITIIFRTKSKNFGQYFVYIVYGTVNVALLFVLDRAFTKLAYVLTDRETHRTQYSYESALIYRLYAFTVAFTFPTLLFFAFIKGSFYTWPSDPARWNTLYGIGMLNCGPFGCMDEVWILLASMLVVKTVGMRIVFSFRSVVTDYNQGCKMNTTIPHHEREYLLKPLDNYVMVAIYRTMVTQFGFTTLFVAAFPLAPLCALISNIIDLRAQARLFTVGCRRPLMPKTPGLGAWGVVMLGIALVSALTNGLTVAWTTKTLQRKTYLKSHSDMRGFLMWSMTEFNTHEYMLMPESAKEWVNYEGYKPKTCYFPGQRHKISTNKGTMWELLHTHWQCKKEEGLFIMIYEHVVIIMLVILHILLPPLPDDIRQAVIIEKRVKELVRAKRTAETKNNQQFCEGKYNSVASTKEVVSHRTTQKDRGDQG